LEASLLGHQFLERTLSMGRGRTSPCSAAGLMTAFEVLFARA
jgi:hypothetical protein